MSASDVKRGSLSGRNPHKLKVGIASKLDTKEVFQLRTATNRSDIHMADQHDEASIVDSDFSTGKLNYENTYKLQPDKKMPTKTVEAAIENSLREQFKYEAYESSKSKKTCECICELIKEKVKALISSRFKLVVVAHVGEKKGQGVQITSRCAWNENFDDFVTAYFTNSSLFVQATVYALYVE